MKDCLYFELDLKQAYKKARGSRAAQRAGPAARPEMGEKKVLAVPEVFYERPIYYKAIGFRWSARVPM